MPATATAIQAGLGLVKTAEGLINAGKTKREAAILEKTRPKLGRDAIADQNLALAKSDLAQGMSAKSEQAYKDLDNSQFSSSLGAILRSGGGANNIGEVYGKGQEGALRLATMQDDLRLQQINNLIRTSQPVQQRDADMFSYNIDAPWKDKAQANAAARTGAQDQIWSGLNTVGSAAMQFAQQKGEKDELNSNDLFNKYFSSNKRSGGGYRSSEPVSTIPNAERQPLQTAINTTPIFNSNNYDWWGNQYESEQF